MRRKVRKNTTSKAKDQQNEDDGQSASNVQEDSVEVLSRRHRKTKMAKKVKMKVVTMTMTMTKVRVKKI